MFNTQEIGALTFFLATNAKALISLRVDFSSAVYTSLPHDAFPHPAVAPMAACGKYVVDAVTMLPWQLLDLDYWECKS
jgi:hypothetical protein